MVGQVDAGAERGLEEPGVSGRHGAPLEGVGLHEEEVVAVPAPQFLLCSIRRFP